MTVARSVVVGHQPTPSTVGRRVWGILHGRKLWPHPAADGSIPRRMECPRLRTITGGLLLALAGIGPLACAKPGAEDLEAFCAVVNDVTRDSSLTTDAAFAAIAARSGEYTKSGSNGPDDVWTKLQATPPEQRYSVLMDAAHSIGKADYKCTSYQKLVATATVEQAKQRAAEEKPDGGVAPDAGAAKVEASPAHEEKAAAKSNGKHKKKKKRHGSR